MSTQGPGPSDAEIVEALLFATDEPLSLRQLSEIMSGVSTGEEGRRVSPEAVLSIIEELNRDYGRSARAFRIVKVAGGYQFATQPQYGIWLGRMIREKSRRKLSVSALESLAVIAYKQPVTKPEIEAIRGVNADHVLRSLLERNLVTITGRAATLGRPLLYGTTKEFLKHFGLNDLSELPKPREINELLAEAEYEVEKRLLKEMEEKNRGEDGEEMGDDLDTTEEMEDVANENGEVREPPVPANTRDASAEPSVSSTGDLKDGPSDARSIEPEAGFQNEAPGQEQPQDAEERRDDKGDGMDKRLQEDAPAGGEDIA